MDKLQKKKLKAQFKKNEQDELVIPPKNSGAQK
jgi:hypothetical protein